MRSRTQWPKNESDLRETQLMFAIGHDGQQRLRWTLLAGLLAMCGCSGSSGGSATGPDGATATTTTVVEAPKVRSPLVNEASRYLNRNSKIELSKFPLRHESS